MPGLTGIKSEPVPPIEARLFEGGLVPAEWTFRGRRNRVFLLIAGTARLTLDKARIPVAAPSVVWLPSGKSGAILFEAGAEGASLAIPDTALGAAMPSGSTFVQVREMVSRPVIGAQLSPAHARAFRDLIAAVARELMEDQPGAGEAVRHHLALLLIGLWRRAEPAAARPQPSPRAIVRGFVHLVELHMREHLTVAGYAAALHVTPDRLNTAVRRVTGRSPADLIHGRLAAEAATLLERSALQISEIAEILGFRDAAYFSRFFKRMTGQSPRDYRAGGAGVRIEADTSFAAWP